MPNEFNRWIGRLEQAGNTEIRTLQDLLDGLKGRHDYFHSHGARLSDHGLLHCYASPCSERDAARIFNQARSGKQVTREEHDGFASLLMLFFGRLDAEKGWTKQMHLGALRSVNSRATANLGADYSAITLLPVVGTDEALVRSYLKHFFADSKASTKEYEPGNAPTERAFFWRAIASSNVSRRKSWSRSTSSPAVTGSVFLCR